MIYEIFKWVFQPEQKMGKNQAECRHASKKTGTNNGDFSVSRNGDSGNRLAVLQNCFFPTLSRHSLWRRWNPIFQKLSPELLLLQVIKAIPIYFI